MDVSSVVSGGQDGECTSGVVCVEAAPGSGF